MISGAFVNFIIKIKLITAKLPRSFVVSVSQSLICGIKMLFHVCTFNPVEKSVQCLILLGFIFGLQEKISISCECASLKVEVVLYLPVLLLCWRPCLVLKDFFFSVSAW